MEIEFSQKLGQTTIRLKSLVDESWENYQKASELWQQITEYEISLLPENEQPGSSFKRMKK